MSDNKHIQKWKKALDNHQQYVVAQSSVIDRGNKDKHTSTIKSTTVLYVKNSGDKNSSIARDIQVESGDDGVECIKHNIHYLHHLHLRRWWIIVWIIILLCIIILSIVVVVTQIQMHGIGNVVRDNEYLISHNKRRKEWHIKYNTTYIPLTWDNSLKMTARRWGKKLLSNCGKGIYHDPNNQGYGENIAANVGSGSWGNMRTTEEVLYSFVEAEENLQPPENGHLTQVLWRSTKYVGCADVVKRMKKDTFCHIQVCRYARIGNCGLKAYESDEPDWWLEPMLANEIRCGPECPPSGCH